MKSNLFMLIAGVTRFKFENSRVSSVSKTNHNDTSEKMLIFSRIFLVLPTLVAPIPETTSTLAVYPTPGGLTKDPRLSSVVITWSM